MKCWPPVLVLLLCVLGVSAQKKDSVASKAPVPKSEDLVQGRKRQYIHFISNRLCDDDKYDIFKIAAFNEAPSVVVVRGHLEIAGDPNQKHVNIKVYNASNNVHVGTYNSSSKTGNYILVLVPNVKYLFRMEISGYGAHEEIVEVPLRTDFEVCRQDIKVKLDGKNRPRYTVINYFTDENEKLYYLKAPPDTTGQSNDAFVPVLKKAGKEKAASRIDDLVKEQLEEEKRLPDEALKAFKANDHETALSLYNELLKRDPADPLYNYYFGVCLVKLDRSKAKAINALQIASAGKDVPSDVFFYLGKACHSIYLFQEAISALENYRKQSRPSDLLLLESSVLLRNCKSGAQLLSEQLNMQVLKRVPVTAEQILNQYNPDLVNDKVQPKAEALKSVTDRKKNLQLLMCKTAAEVYYPGFGEKDVGLDIYRRKLTASGGYGFPEKLDISINSPSDENYVYLSADGLNLYFASKGLNSMGGYDIFRCTRDNADQQWSEPHNLGYPINSTYDDFLFIPDTKSGYASFCSNRRGGKLEYFQVQIREKTEDVSVIKGTFTTRDSVPLKEAIISVFSASSGELAGVYRTNPANGSYLMILPSSTKYEITVEAKGYSEASASFMIPPKKTDFILRQEIVLNKKSAKNAEIKNYFTEESAAAHENESVLSEDPPQTINRVVTLKKPARSAEESKHDLEDLSQARKLFSQAAYQEAGQLFHKLDEISELEPEDLYKYGLCLYHTKRDRLHCARVLERAAKGKNIPADLYYYLAKACQLGYRFSTAIQHYNKFASLSKPGDLQKLNIQQEIAYCKNGIRLVNDPAVVEVYERKHVGLNFIQNALSPIESGAKILLATEDIISPLDKKKNYKPLFYLAPDKNTLFYSSYGTEEDGSKDIYMLKKLPNGKWSAPLKVPGINSEADEEFPALSKDGKTLYFSSRGFDSMGDYDIFKSSWNEETQTWSAPVNLGSPINSPYEDIFFVE